MIPRNRLDIGWRDLAYGISACIVARKPDALRRRLESSWTQSGSALTALSVRSGFDALLEALALPAGSEVIVSAVTIRDMTRIVEAHGLVPVPVDLDIARLAVQPEALAKAIGPRTRAVLIAHLFGARMPMEPLVAVARRHNMIVIEDCAQAYAADAFRGCPLSDVTLFSFGTIKTATALGGAVLGFRDAALCERVERVQRTWPMQSRARFLRRCVRTALLHVLSARGLYGIFVRLCRVLGFDHDQVISASVRGFGASTFFARIREQPCAPLLALLSRRLSASGRTQIARRVERARQLAEDLPGAVWPGSACTDHTHWVLPILHDDPEGLMQHLWAAGFDATRGASSMGVVGASDGEGRSTAPEARHMFARLLYLPCAPGMSDGELERLAAATRAYRSQKTASPRRVADGGARSVRA